LTKGNSKQKGSDINVSTGGSMTVPGEITNLSVDDELHICPACGYTLGFHTSFLNVNANKERPVKSTRDVYRVILICPECGARYDVGWRISFSEGEKIIARTTVIQAFSNPGAEGP
jgi:hypothetical protein